MELFSLASKSSSISKFVMYTKKLSYLSNGYTDFQSILTQNDIKVLTQEADHIIKAFKKEALPTRSYAFNNYSDLDTNYTNSINQLIPFISAEGFDKGVLKPNYESYITSIGNGTYNYQLCMT